MLLLILHFPFQKKNPAFRADQRPRPLCYSLQCVDADRGWKPPVARPGNDENLVLVEPWLTVTVHVASSTGAAPDMQPVHPTLRGATR